MKESKIMEELEDCFKILEVSLLSPSVSLLILGEFQIQSARRPEQ